MLGKPFDGPIPGESLTRPPRQFAWERPPEYVSPDDVMDYYLERIMKPKVMERIMDSLELGFPIKKLVDGILRVGVSEGIHTIDAGILVAPAIHDAIKGVADELGIDYEEGLEDKRADEEYEEKLAQLKVKRRTRELLKEMSGTNKKEPMGSTMAKSDSEFVFDDQMELPMDMPEEEPKRGLMAREKM